MNKINAVAKWKVDFRGIIKEYPPEDGWSVNLTKLYDKTFYAMLERENDEGKDYRFFVKGTDGTDLFRRINNFSFVPVDFFCKDGDDFITYILHDPDSMMTFITNDDMLNEGDLVLIGPMVTSTDITPDGKFVAVYYGAEGGAPTMSVSSENDLRNDYSSDCWRRKKTDCLAVHVDGNGVIWINTSDDGNELLVFRKVMADPECVKTEDMEFDGFGLSDDETKLLVCHTTGEETRLFLMEKTDEGYCNEREVSVNGFDSFEDVSFFRNSAMCRLDGMVYAVDINRL